MSISLLSLIGSAHAGLLAAVLIGHPALRRSAATRYLAAILALGAVVVAMISLQHGGLLQASTPWLLLEENLSILAGPLLLGFVLQALRGRHPPWWAWSPWLLHALGAASLGESLRHWLRIEHLMWLQMAYTAAAVWAWAQSRRLNGARGTPAHVLFVLGVFISIHLAQLVRLFWHEVTLLQNIVPWVASAGFAALIVYALLESRTLAGMAAPPVAAEDQHRYALLAERIRRLMDEQQPWRDPTLTLEQLACAVQCAPAELSAALNRHLQRSFHEFVNDFRVAEACRLLRDPAERRYSVDGLGRQAGFGSRSGFYKVFKAGTGQSPAEYRRAHQA